MGIDWYYVHGKDRVGPVCVEELSILLASEKIDRSSYVWRKGFANWERLADVSELAYLLERPSNKSSEKYDVEIPPIFGRSMDWSNIQDADRIFTIKTGVDRSGPGKEYGPFSLTMLKQLFDEKRISEKTFVFAVGMDDWTFLGDIPIYSKYFSATPPVIDEIERRASARRPFIAQLLFHDNNLVFEGVCKDVSMTGASIMVANFPAKLGERISINVHPDHSDYCFVANGKIVRVSENEGIAIEFIDLSNEASVAISKYLSQD